MEQRVVWSAISGAALLLAACGRWSKALARSPWAASKYFVALGLQTQTSAMLAVPPRDCGGSTQAVEVGAAATLAGAQVVGTHSEYQPQAAVAGAVEGVAVAVAHLLRAVLQHADPQGSAHRR